VLAGWRRAGQAVCDGTVTAIPGDEQARDDQARGDELVILHWNVHSWRDTSGQPNLDAVIGLVTGLNPDVVSLVEVNEPWAAAVSVPELARQAGYSWIFFPTVEFGRDAPARGYGNALLSRLPVVAAQQWRLTWPPAVYDGTEPSESRSVALVRVSLPAATVWAGSTHLPSTSRRARAAALRRLTAVTQGLDRPWVICGDFNTAPSQWIRHGQPIVTGPHPARPTFPARSPIKALDYCIASPGVSLHARPLKTAGSDHLPLLARCQITGRGQAAGEPARDGAGR
jgi:endonuclease/exonuclease/phosphatase family metal-dependent hydrolase